MSPSCTVLIMNIRIIIIAILAYQPQSATACSPPCGTNAICVNDTTTPDARRCECRPGFDGDAYIQCTEVNECWSRLNHPCAPGGYCIDTYGSFECYCHLGWTADNATTPCLDIDECALGTHDCHESTVCVNVPGRFSCECLSGYKKEEIWQLDGAVRCVDDDECAIYNRCWPHGTCVNMIGTYVCQCNTGYVANGLRQCVDIDECNEKERLTPACPNGFSCVNYDGGHTCNDHDDCGHGTHSCPVGYDCVNLYGSYSCEDIDECTISGSRISQDPCVASVGI
jgi:hypothetical protein